MNRSEKSFAHAPLKRLGMQRQAYYFSGEVQGVGFRYAVRNLAMQYAVAGYVRNLPDGRVELVIEGPDDQVNHLVKDVSRKMNGFIRHIDRETKPATGEFSAFSIRR